MIRSAGLIVFRQNKKGETLFLLLRSRAGFWGFPKGRLEKGETNMRAAVREVREETGLKGFFIASGFRARYSFLRNGVPKTVVLQAAKSPDARVALSREHADYVWASYGDAHKLLSFANARRALKSCYDYIRRSRLKIASQEAVYRATRKIPKGKVATYAAVARIAGKGVHPRTAGIMLNKNYDPKVPCHRVISSDGRLGGYNRGIAEKIQILKKEKVAVHRHKGIPRVDLKRYGYLA